MSDPNDPDAPRSVVPFGLERAIAAIAIGAIFVISLGNTLVRYITNQSFAFTEEYSIFLVVVMTFAGTATAFALHRNIAVTFIRDAMPKRVADGFDIVAALASLLMFGLIAYYGGKLAYEEWFYGRDLRRSRQSCLDLHGLDAAPFGGRDGAYRGALGVGPSSSPPFHPRATAVTAPC